MNGLLHFPRVFYQNAQNSDRECVYVGDLVRAAVCDNPADATEYESDSYPSTRSVSVRRTRPHAVLCGHRRDFARKIISHSPCADSASGTVPAATYVPDGSTHFRLSQSLSAVPIVRGNVAARIHTERLPLPFTCESDKLRESESKQTTCQILQTIL